MTPDLNERAQRGTLPSDPMKGARPINGAAQRKASAASAPTIRIGADLHRVVDEATTAIARDDGLFQRDAQLVRIVRVAEPETQRERMAPGSPQIRPLAIATLRERLTRVARFERWDGRSEKWVDCVPTDRIVSAVDARGEWPGVRPLVGVIETPSMRPDGTIIGAPGYDAATGYVYQPHRTYPPVPAKPTPSDAARALAELAEPWADFPFRGEAERVVPIAALLTLVARPAIRGACPAFVLDKSVRGAGGSLLARAITTLAHGREAALMTWPPDEIELEKILASYALRGAVVIVWDNVVGTLGGGPLDRVLTCADRTELRVLGKSEVPALSWRAVMIPTGNNMVIGADTTRRVLVGRLEPDCEHPEERTDYQIADLPAWCQEHHPRLVVASLTLLRAYVVAGRPDMGLAGWGSFEAWRDLIGSALVWAGAPDVMATRPTLAGHDDDETAALRVLVQLWPMLAPDGASARTALDALYPAERQRGEAIPDAYDGLREALETLAPPQRPGAAPTTRKLGNALARYRRRVVGDRYIDFDMAHGQRVWKVSEVRR